MKRSGCVTNSGISRSPPGEFAQPPAMNPTETQKGPEQTANAASVLIRAENALPVAALLLAVLLPLIEMVGRPLGGIHIAGSALYVQQLTFWLAFLGGLLAARENKHLVLSTTNFLGETRTARVAKIIAFATAASVTAALAYGSYQLVLADREIGKMLPIGLPEWVSECIMPVALALMSLRFVLGASDRIRGRLCAVLAIAAVLGMGFLPFQIGPLVYPLVALILIAALAGAPVFVAMGGIALLLFFREQVPISAVPAEVYRLVASPTLPAIPLLTA
ncbi:MAG TPA: TRAP transporter small permease, partial [Acidobacteriota bacterium]|nr:TRAP transporter small permease [Acidobacteriota bacterium]